MIKLPLIVNKAGRKVLRRLYGFAKWHDTPLTEKPYAEDIIRHCNARADRDYFVEIGCGLGDIIRRVDFRNRKGYDIDQKVLNAATLLPVRGKPESLTFEQFSFPESGLNGRFDVIILVNWIHDITPKVLKKQLDKYFNENLLDNGEIIIDTVHDEEYPNRHEIEFQSKGLNCTVFRLGEYARLREVWSMKKTV